MTAVQRFEAQADPECLEQLHASLDALWHAEPGVAKNERMRFTTAVAEIVANVVEHGRTADGGSPVLAVELEAGAARLRAQVEDDGVAYDAHPPEAAELDESGRGIELARSAVDSLVYEHSSGRNRWEIVLATASS